MTFSIRRACTAALGMAAAVVLVNPAVAHASTGFPPSQEGQQVFDVRGTGFGRDASCTVPEGFPPGTYLSIEALGDTSGESGAVAFSHAPGPVAPVFPLGEGTIRVHAVDHHWWETNEDGEQYHVEADRPATPGVREERCSYSSRDAWGSVRFTYVDPPAPPTADEIGDWCEANLDGGADDGFCPWELAPRAPAPK